MTSADRRVRVATQLRELGHTFVARELSDEELDDLADHVEGLVKGAADAPMRVRRPAEDGPARMSAVAAADEFVEVQFFADTLASGAANPMGLGAVLWREGETAVMRVTFGYAFEGAPGIAHGGALAALIDETMGVAMVIQGARVLTAQLDITFRAPTPILEPVTARAWLQERVGRKLTVAASVTCADVVVADATALFIAVDPTRLDGSVDV